jgi:cyanate permease
MERPWWMLAFLIPLCCGSTFLAFLLGVGGGGLLGGLVMGPLAAGPWGSLVFGSLMGAAFSVPLIVFMDRRTRPDEACALKQH